MFGFLEKEKCHLLRLLLSDNEGLWFGSLRKDIQKDWDMLQNEFIAHFIDNGYLRQQRTLDLLKFNQGEQSFKQYFAYVVCEMNSVKFPKQLQISLIIKNLNPELRCLILQYQPYATKDELYQKGINLENALQNQQKCYLHRLLARSCCATRSSLLCC